MERMVWIMLHPQGLELVGFLPGMLNPNDDRSATEQLDAGYAHGGGWRPYKGFTLDRETGALSHPGDPTMKPVAATTLRNEVIYVYEYGWVAVIKEDKSYEVCRMD